MRVPGADCGGGGMRECGGEGKLEVKGRETSVGERGGRETTGRRERSGAKWKRERRENQKTRLKGEEGVSRSQK